MDKLIFFLNLSDTVKVLQTSKYIQFFIRLKQKKMAKLDKETTVIRFTEMNI